MPFDKPPEQPEIKVGPALRLGCLGILSGVGINLVVFLVAIKLPGDF